MWRAVSLVAVAVALVGCAHKKRTSLPAIPVKIGQTETGIASWYGHPYHGRQSASGEVYDMEAMVAAHQTMPFQTWVRVTNLSNHKTVDVRIIDRGPFIKGRIIDLSHAAAQAIEMVGPGIAKVRLVVIKPPLFEPATPVPATPAPVPVAPLPPAPMLSAPDIPAPAAPETAATFAVQVGVFRSHDNAEQLRARMALEFGSAQILPQAGSQTLWRVLVGAEQTEDAANTLATRVRDKSGEKNAFVVRLDPQQ